jgi:hypothetical protein
MGGGMGGGMGSGMGGRGGRGVGMADNNGGWQSWQSATLELSAEFWDKVDTGFEARSGQVNEWTIPMPDELIGAVRAALKVNPAATAKPSGAAVPAH